MMSWNFARSRFRPTLCIALASLVLACVLFLPHLGRTPLVYEEPKRAVIARTMMDTGDYLIPRLAGDIYTVKPPAYNWLICLTSWATGGEVTEFSARASSLLSSVLLTLFLLFATRRALSPPGQVLLALAVLLTPFMAHNAMLAEIEMMFTFTVSLSLYTWYLLDRAGWRGLALWAPPALLAGLSFLVKREPGLVFFYLGVFAYLLVKKRWRELLSPGAWAGGFLSVALIAAWMGPLAMQTSVQFIRDSYFSEIAHHSRPAGHALQHAKNMLVYPFQMFGTLFPLSLLLLPLAWPSVRRALAARFKDDYLFPLVVTVANFPIYWFTAKAERYFMPMFPLLFVLAAMVYEAYRHSPEGLPPRVRWLLDGITRLALGLTALVAAVLILSPGLPLAGGLPKPWIFWPFTLYLGGGLLAMAIWGLRKKGKHRVCLPAFAGLLISVQILMFAVILPIQEKKFSRMRNGPALAKDVLSHLPKDTKRILVVGHQPNSLYFYAPEIQFQRIGMEAKTPGEPQWVLVQEILLERFRKTGPPFQEVARFEYNKQGMYLLRTEPQDQRPPSAGGDGALTGNGRTR